MLKREKRKIQQHCIFSKIPKQYYYPSLKCACLNSQYTQINHKITKNKKKPYETTKNQTRCYSNGVCVDF